jgi:hypothetical protein
MLYNRVESGSGWCFSGTVVATGYLRAGKLEVHIIAEAD